MSVLGQSIWLGLLVDAATTPAITISIPMAAVAIVTVAIVMVSQWRVVSLC